jgi:hypothetical protein
MSLTPSSKNCDGWLDGTGITILFCPAADARDLIFVFVGGLSPTASFAL